MGSTVYQLRCECERDNKEVNNEPYGEYESELQERKASGGKSK